MKYRAVTFLISLVLLSGCTVTPKTYQAPTSGPVAKINFVNNSSSELRLNFYGGAAGCTDRREVIVIQEGRSEEYSVAAGQEIAFSARLFGSGERFASSVGGLLGASLHKGCDATLDFMPENDGDYTFTMTRTAASQCNYSLDRRLDDKSKAAAQEFKLKEWTRPWDSKGPFCKE